MIVTDLSTGLNVDNIKIKTNNYHPNSSWKIGLEIIKGQVLSIFSLLLIVASIISFALNEPNDGSILLFILTANLVLGFFQEFRANKAAEKLENLIKLRVKVIRNSKLQEIDSKDLLVGDIVHLISGDVVPADIWVREVSECFIDESVRTGETQPISLQLDAVIYAGASIVSGRLIGQIAATGNESSLGKYKATLLRTTKDNSFEKFVNTISRYILISTTICLVVVMIYTVGISRSFDFAEFLLFAIALLVGVVPEALPLIITIILTSESLNLAKNKVIVKRLVSLQELGAIKFLLTDKTGTLTENKISVAETLNINKLSELSEIISIGIYDRTPMDKVYDQALKNYYNLESSFNDLIGFEPFKNDLGYSQFFTKQGKNIIRGKFSNVIDLLPKADDKVRNQYIEWEKQGFRVLAVAYRENKYVDWQLSGLIAFEDPLKPDIKEVLVESKAKGIEIKILTGDSLLVSSYVAKKLNLIDTDTQVIDLETIKISDLSNEQLVQAKVFARCTPENKLQLIERYLSIGPVGFLGEGINDALALKKADVGMVVDNASDVARQSADIILLEKSLSPILKGITAGRQAFSNVITYLNCTLAGNIGTFVTLIIVTLFWKFIPMRPVQILLNNLLTDIPLIFVITDFVDKTMVDSVPTYSPKNFIRKLFLFGIASSLFDIIFFLIVYNGDIAYIQTSWFIFSVICELVLILSLRSNKILFKAHKMSLRLKFGIFTAGLIAILITIIPYTRDLFHFTRLNLENYILIFFLVCVYVFTNELIKVIISRKQLKN